VCTLRTQLAEIQAHIGLGALLGYPVADLHGIHVALCKRPCGLPCKPFYYDAMAAFSTIEGLVPTFAKAAKSALICHQLRHMNATMHMLSKWRPHPG
jgi:hypothetical protein